MAVEQSGYTLFLVQDGFLWDQSAAALWTSDPVAGLLLYCEAPVLPFLHPLYEKASRTAEEKKRVVCTLAELQGD